MRLGEGAAPVFIVQRMERRRTGMKRNMWADIMALVPDGEQIQAVAIGEYVLAWNGIVPKQLATPGLYNPIESQEILNLEYESGSEILRDIILQSGHRRE